MKIKSVTIEGLHNVIEKTCTFDNLSYLYGKNGAGKSTVLQAIQLALLGYIPGVDKKNEAILRHAKGKTLSVTCVLDNGVTVTRSWVGTGKSVTKAVDISPEGFDLESVLADIELPVYNFSEFMSMTANKMKDWFISFLPDEAADVNWEDQLTKSLGDMKVIDEELMPNTLAQLKELPGTGVEYIRAVNTYFKDQTSFLKGNLQRTQGTIQSLVLYEDCDSTASSEDIQNEIADIQSKLIQASKIEQVRKMNERIHEQLSLITVSGTSTEDDPEYAKLQESLAELELKIAPKFKSDMDDILQKKAQLDDKIKELNVSVKNKSNIIAGQGMCPYTKSSCNAIKELIGQLEEEVNEEMQQINSYAKELSALANSFANSDVALKSTQSTIADTKNKMNQIASKYAELSRLSSQLQMEELIDGEEADTAQLQNKLNELQAQVAKVAANEQYNKLIDQLTAEKFKIENTLEVLKIWTKLTDANGLQTTMMVAPFEKLAASMDDYLHKMFNRKDSSVKFNLSEKANSFSFGLVRDEKYIEFDMLSSGEKCMYTLALMMCLVNAAKSPLKLIMIDDLLDHLDDANANKLFDALYKIKDIQFILAGVKECTSKCSNDIVVEVGGK